MSDISSKEVLDNLSALPQGWVWTHVDEISSLIRGVSYNKSEALKTSKEGFLPILRATNINKQLNFDDLVYVPIPCISSEQMIRKFDVIFAMSSGSKDLVGKSAQAISDFHGGFGTFCGLIRPLKGLNKQYFGFFFQSPEYRKKISTLSSGIGINNLRRDDIESIVFPLPPHKEQHRIVTKIEELFTQLDAGVASLKKVQVQLKRYRQAVLKAAFEGRLTQEWREEHKGEIEPASVLFEKIKRENHRDEKEIAKRLPLVEDELLRIPKEWIWVQAQDICENITNGYTPTAEKLFERSGEIPFIKVYNLTKTGPLDFTVKPTFINRVTHETELRRSAVYPQDVLMNIVGPPLGKVSLVPELHPEWNINQAIVIYRTFPEYSRKLMLYALLSETIQKWLRKRGKTTAGQTNYTITMSRSLPIPLPPLNEQLLIVNEIERHFSQIDHIEQTITTSLRQAETLRQSILKRAFEGKLVPQDPNDEPASILLERIKAEKAHHATETKKGKTLQPKSPKRKIPNGN